MSMWTLGMSHTYTHTHTHLYQRFKVLFSEVVTSATSQQPHKPCCIVMATVCHSEHGDNKAPYKHYVLNIRSLSSCHRACFMFWGEWEDNEKPKVTRNQPQGLLAWALTTGLWPLSYNHLSTDSPFASYHTIKHFRSWGKRPWSNTAKLYRIWLLWNIAMYF